MLRGLSCLFCAVAPLLGSELREEGYALRPPAGFSLQRVDAFRGTGALAVGTSQALGALSALLLDGDGPDAAAQVIARVDGSFDAHPAARDELSGQVARHFEEELGMTFALESAWAVPGPVPRIEVLGTVSQEGQARHVLVAALAGEGKHVVITFSAPSGRYLALAPAMEASLDSFHAESPSASPLSRRVAGAVAGGLAGAIVVSLTLWRRRKPPAPDEKAA